MQYRYTGGVQEVAVVLPTRTLEVTTGDVVELDELEAAKLDAHPDWTPADAETAGDELELDALRKPELIELAAARGVDPAGTRDALIERLSAATVTTTNTSQEDTAS
jgi:hypothetical protein